MLCGRFLASCAVLAMSAIISAACLSVDTAAAYEGGQFMSASDFREILGDDIVCEYFNGSEYVEGHFYYYGTTTGLTFRDDTLTNVSSYQLLRYTTSLPGLSYSNEYITVHLSPKFSITDTKIINTFIGMRTQYDVSASAYNQSTWDWMFSGTTLSFVAPDYEGNYRNSYIGGNNYCTIPVQMSSDQLSSGYSFDVKFYGAGAASNAQLIIGVPYISVDASVAEGTLPPVTTAPSGGDINVTVDVDLQETNGILGDIKEGIAGLAETLLDGIKGLFVPDEDFMTDFKDDMETLLEDHLGGLYEAEQLVENFVEELPDVVEKESIYIPACNIPLAGTTFTLGDWTVPLKVSGMPAILYNSIAFIIDFLCTTAFVNMCRKKLEIFLNPDSEVITE